MDCELREYSQLFNIDNPAEMDNYLNHINKDSLKVVQAKIPKSFNYVKNPRLQFERMGFYYLDSDSNEDNQ